MFRIRRLAGAGSPADLAALAEAQAILRDRFPGLDPAEVEGLAARLEDPFGKGLVARLILAETARARVVGVALVLLEPRRRFAFLDLLATARGARGGTGGALYAGVREEAAEAGAEGLWFECLPDEPATCPDATQRRENARRLRFYEGFGAFPVTGTAYQTPLRPGETGMPFLMFDGLGRHALPGAERLREVVRLILERKYRGVCPPEYVEAVVGSIREGGFALRPPRHAVPEPRGGVMPARPIPLVVNDRHDIHHVRERGYVESPVRIPAILGELERTGLFRQIPPRPFPDRWVREVHDGGLVDYLETACAEAPEKSSVYPYVFPVRNAARQPRERSVLAGYWCIDTFTPINRNAWPAARRAVDCALTAADEVLNGAPVAYALVRPPGHHAERRTFGGFCYLSNAAIAANYLSHRGRVAMLDIDYHHGNGQQDIFYERGDVLTVSIHGDPAIAYPYFTGFADETGRGEGAGMNLNLPLPEGTTAAEYRAALSRALDRIAEFRPDFLVLCLGYDTAKGDPTGTWSNGAADFRRIGREIGGRGWPVVVVQEGGYRVRTLGTNARSFFEGLAEGVARVVPTAPAPPPEPPRFAWRTALRPEDPARIRALVAATGRFSPEEVEIAEELPRERLEKGGASGYEFVLATEGERLLGYACYGPIPGSEVAWDLYWIAVAPEGQGSGLGTRLLARVEAAVARAGGRALYADTSSSAPYAATRGFYEAKGFRRAAEFPDFYREGDGKIVYAKEMR